MYLEAIIPWLALSRFYGVTQALSLEAEAALRALPRDEVLAPASKVAPLAGHDGAVAKHDTGRRDQAELARARPAVGCA